MLIWMPSPPLDPLREIDLQVKWNWTNRLLQHLLRHFCLFLSSPALFGRRLLSFRRTCKWIGVASIVKTLKLKVIFPTHVIFLLFPYENSDSHFANSIFHSPVPADFLSNSFHLHPFNISLDFLGLLNHLCIFWDWIWTRNRLLLLDFQFRLCYWTGLINSPFLFFVRAIMFGIWNPRLFIVNCQLSVFHREFFCWGFRSSVKLAYSQLSYVIL